MGLFKDHPAYNGLPTNTAMNWDYQVDTNSASGLLIDGNGVNIIAAYRRDHDRNIGAATFTAPLGSGTRLTLWINIDRRFMAWGAAGWHIAFDVLDRLLSGNPIGRLAGADAMKFDAWKRLVGEYAKQFEIETTNVPKP